MNFMIFLSVMVQLYSNQECHNYTYKGTFIEIQMFINLNNYLTHKKNKMKSIKICRFIKSIIERVNSSG